MYWCQYENDTGQPHTNYGALRDGMSICTRFGLSNSHNSLALSSLYHVMDPGHPFEFPSVLYYSPCIDPPYRTAIAGQDTCNSFEALY